MSKRANGGRGSGLLPGVLIGLGVVVGISVLALGMAYVVMAILFPGRV